MRDAAGRSRCFAFLTFDDPASVNAVMVREHILDGKIVSQYIRMADIIFSYISKIDPKRAIPRQEHQRATKLFIGGLAGSVTSESMREFFSQFGKVVDSTVMLDRETGRSKGFGFVSLEDVNVQPLLGFGQLEIDGKQVRLFGLFDVKPLPSDHIFRSMLNWPNRGINATTIRTTMALGAVQMTSRVVAEVASIINNSNNNRPILTQQLGEWAPEILHLTLRHSLHCTLACFKCRI